MCEHVLWMMGFLQNAMNACVNDLGKMKDCSIAGHNCVAVYCTTSPQCFPRLKSMANLNHIRIPDFRLLHICGKRAHNHGMNT